MTRHAINFNDISLQLRNLAPEFIIGDFNAKHTWWGCRVINPKGTLLLKCVRQMVCSVYFTGEPTYWLSDSAKIPELLDLAISKGIRIFIF